MTKTVWKWRNRRTGAEGYQSHKPALANESIYEWKQVPAADLLRLDVAGNVKPEATLLEREAVLALNDVKAWLDDPGNTPLPVDVRVRIDAVLMMAEQRRIGLARG